MKDIFNAINVSFAALGGFIGWLFGGPDGFFYALAVFAAADYITGVTAAAVKKQLSSSIGFNGIAKKVTIFIIVAAANMIDKYVIAAGSAVRTAVIFFYLSNEGISILENAAIIGLPVPKILKELLLKINEEDTTDE